MRAVMLVALLAPLAIHAAAPPGAAPAGSVALREGNARFAQALYAELRKADGNLCFSPYSISSALGMLSAGARGETLGQIQRAMHSPPQAELHPAMKALRDELASRRRKGVELSIANALWAQAGHPVLPSFNGLLRANHGSEIDTAAFATEPEVSRLMLNRWVSLQTRRKVQDLFPEGSITPLTRLVLANAVYFKGDWASKFKTEKTKAGPFLTASGKVDVPMMSQNATFPCGETDACKLVELPFAGDELSLALALPLGGRTLDDVEQEFVSGKLHAAMGKLARLKVELTLPRFKVASSLELPDVLRKLGMEDVFGDKADLSGIGGKELQLKAVMHKAVLEVNEEGGEAAAATGAVVSARSRIRFTADRPFVFLLRDRKTGTILFVGRVVDPSKG